MSTLAEMGEPPPPDCLACAQVDGSYQSLEHVGNCRWEFHGASADIYWFFDGISWDFLYQGVTDPCVNFSAVVSTADFNCEEGQGVDLISHLTSFSRCSLLTATLNPLAP